METAALIVSIVLAVILVASAAAKLTRAAPVVESLSKVGVSDQMFPVLAALEIAGAIGLVAGLWVPALGIAAAIGVIGYFVGAVTYHVRAKDPGYVPPAALGLLAVAALVLRLLAD